jgi:hypothetical protein
MTEPVILSDAILHQARLWRDECLRHWSDADPFPRIGEETLASPVDGSRRKVVLHLSNSLLEGGRPVKGKTAVGIFFDVGDIRDGYTVVINRGMIHLADHWMPVLLHELIHAVDPEFDRDFGRLNQQQQGGPRTPLTAVELYHLPSEQRAFPGMWIQDLWEDLGRGQYHNPSVSIALYCQRSPEFRGFWENTPSLAQQTEDHVRRIVWDLKVRRSNVSEEQLKAIQEFAALPIYDEDDEAADSITRVQSSGGRFTSIREMTTLEDVREALRNPSLVPLGGVRYRGSDDTVVVFAYFGAKRP